MIKKLFSSFKNSQNEEFNALTSSLNVGFGDRYSYNFCPENVSSSPITISTPELLLDDTLHTNPKNLKIKNFNPEQFQNLQHSLSKAKYTIYWLTENWEENWFNVQKIQDTMDAGYIPVFIYWYFGDKLIKKLDEEMAERYTQNTQKLANFLEQFEGIKLVIMEPEFNKASIINSKANTQRFIKVLENALETLKTQIPNSYYSLCMTDTGNRNATPNKESGFESYALSDIDAWASTEAIYYALLPKLDFISFQEMLAPFSRDPHNPGSWKKPNPIHYSDTQLGIDHLSTRILNLSKYLNKTYKKPVFLPYIGIGTVTSRDQIATDVWEQKLLIFYKKLSISKKALHKAGLFGYAPMNLFDDPQHDVGGYQYFLENEYHLGIVKSSAIGGKDFYMEGDIKAKSNTSLLAYIFGE